jgi:putative membrane protein
MSKRIYAVAICALMLVACAKKGTSPEPEAAENPELSAVNTPPPSVAPSGAETNTASAGMETNDPMEQGAGTGTGMAPAAPAPVATTPPETLTDDQIAKITETVDAGEVEQGRIAQKKAKNARVKKFASHMVTQHTKSKKQNATLVKKAQITPADSTTAQTLSEKSSQTLATLESTESPDFDKKYIDAQIEQHENVVLLLDSKLIPNASNADLKARLEETKKLVETHLTEAKEIQQSLASAESPTPMP